MGRQAIYDAMCIRPEDEPSMTAFIASAGRRTYGKAIRDEAGALGYSLPATMPNDPYSLAAISDLAAHHAASIRAGYNPRLARAINALPDGITDDQVRRLLQPFIDSTRIYNTGTLYPLLNARLRALGIGHFYDRNGIKSQYRIMPDESDYDDDCQADIDLGIVDSLDNFSRTDYPWHPHCFVAGTIIDGPLVHASFSRPYQGPIVTISTASGDKLTGTPNHPVLTTEGWVILGALHKGNNILRCIDARQLSLVIACWLGLPNPDEHQIPTKIEHLFAAPSMALFQVPCSTTHFHGDGMADGYVGIKYINCSFDANGNIRQFAKHVSNDELLTTGPTHGSLFRDGSLDFLLPGVDLASASVLSSGGLARALLRSLATRAKPPTFAGVTDCDSSLPQSFEHQPVTNPLLAGQINGRFAGIVTPDKIVNVRKEYGACHVYNSSTHQGWFAANGFIVSNCGYDGQPHMIVRVNIDPQTLPAPEELWDSTQGPVKSIIVIKEFDESQHPRDEHGRFSDSGGGANGSLSSLMPLHPSTAPGVTMIQERSAADNYTQWAFSELVSDPPNNADTNLDNERSQYFQAMQDAESRDDYHTYVFAALSAPALDEGEESEHEQGLWEELRTMQADTVAGRIRSDGEQFSTETAQRFMDQWSESAVSTEYSQSLQHAAADRWSVPVTPMVEEHGEWHDPILDQEAARLLNAQYDLTQEWYSAYPQTTQRGENGDRYVYLYRGMSFRPDSIPSALQSVGEHMPSEGEPWDEINIRQNPLSSWTSIIGTAQDFARAQEQAGLQGYILAARAPTSRILGNGITGIGAIREGEHVVIGGLDKVTATRIG